MGILAMDAIQRQVSGMVRKPVNEAKSRIKKATNLNRRASKAAAGTVQTLRKAAGEARAPGVVILTRQQLRTAEKTGGVVITAPDGYVRQSPVQELRIPADYYPRRRRRIIGAVVAGLALAVLIYLAIRLGWLQPNLTF